MFKIEQHQAGDTAIQDSEQQRNRLRKKFFRAKLPKMLRKILGTTALIALASVNLGRGGGSGQFVGG
jgi:DNA-binding TFAR19-related protein (PDSD5 family)